MNRIITKAGILAIGFLLLSTAVWGQNISLNLNGVTVKAAMEALKNQYTYSFVFEARDVDTQKTISVDVTNATVDETVRQIIQGQNLSYEIKGRNIVLSKPVDQTDSKKSAAITVKGVVTDENGIPVAGATVTDDTSNGTITGIKGDFTLKTTSGATLTIQYVGYVTQKVPVRNRTNVMITLQQDAQLIQDVVVVGYGTQKKENLTGAVATLDTKAIENRSVSNIAQALQGTVGNLNISPNASNSTGDWESAGGAPGAAQSINIRGYTGFDNNGYAKSDSPLIVIDGVPGGDLNTINMNDVENISVLKDAASSAIYGSSAPFGVILITTKRGSVGQKATISYSNNFMFSQPISLPSMMNSLDYAMAFNQFSVNAATNQLYSAGTLKRIIDYMNGARETETIADTTTDSWLGTFSSNGNNNWFNIYFKDVSFSQQHNLSVSGGTEKTNYYMGVGYLDQEGMYTYGNDYYKRYNARVSLQTEIAKWISVGFRGAFQRGVKDTPNYATFANANIIHMLAMRRPSQALYNPDGNFSNGSYVNAFRDGGRIHNVSDEGNLVGEIILRPMKGWDVVANYSFTGTYGHKLTHLATVYHTLPSGKTSTLSGTSPNSLTRRMDRNERHAINAYTSYGKQIGGHEFKVMVGYMQEVYETLYLSGGNNELYSDNVLSLATTYGTKISATDLNQQVATRGVFGRINYNYKEKYLIEFNTRYDATSRFLKDVRWKFYPGVSGAWVPSKESFWEPILPVVNFFKLRASYGSQASQGSAGYYDFYPALRTYSPTSSSNNWLFAGTQEPMVSYPSDLVNPSLTWVTTSTIDFGLDMGMLDNRLNVSFDWYKRSAKDYQGPAEALPAILGTSAPQTNNAAMETRGFELTIGWRHHISKVNYSIDVVLSDYESVITKYPNPTKTFLSGTGTVYNNRWYEGRKVGEIWGFETVGLFQSQEEIDNAPDQSALNTKPWTVGDVRYADINGDGKITYGNLTLDDPGDMKVIGNSTPRYAFGITLAADWNGIDFRAFIQGVAKRDSPANHNTGEYRFANFVWGVPRQGSYAQATMWENHHDRWSAYNTPEENASAYFPKYYFSDENMKNTFEQTRYLQNSAYVRLKNIQIGYSFPDKWISKISLQKLRVFVNVENIVTWTKMISTLDPEFSTSDGKLYPLQRVWAIGLNATF
jgi:TonB-linked SusC/RagA family outer membrane protein